MKRRHRGGRAMISNLILSSHLLVPCIIIIYITIVLYYNVILSFLRGVSGGVVLKSAVNIFTFKV